MSESQILATKVKNLVNDDTYKVVMAGVREEQNKIFLDPKASSEAVLEAHEIIRALAKIDGQITRLQNAAIVDLRKEHQHRGKRD